jgi:leucyl aminopeptidase
LESDVERTDEPVWLLPMIPLSHPARLGIADMTNPRSTQRRVYPAAVFLKEFMARTTWAHIDIAGTAQAEATTRWIPKGASGTYEP